MKMMLQGIIATHRDAVWDRFITQASLHSMQANHKAGTAATSRKRKIVFLIYTSGHSHTQTHINMSHTYRGDTHRGVAGSNGPIKA